MAAISTRAALGALATLVAVGCAPKRPVQYEEAPAYDNPAGRNDVRLHVAEALLDAGKTREAQQVLVVAMEEGADIDEIHLLQGRALLMDGLYGEAEPLIEQARRGMPRDPRTYRLLGVIQADTGRPEEAIASFTEATRLDPSDAASWNNLGFLLLSQKRHADARAALSKAVALDGGNARYRTNLGFALVADGRGSEALQVFRTVGSEADAHANVGLAYELAGEADQAATHYGKALTANPAHTGATEGLRRIESTGQEGQP